MLFGIKSSPSVSESSYAASSTAAALALAPITLPAGPPECLRRYLRLMATATCRHELMFSFVPRCRTARSWTTRRILSDD